MIGVGKKTQEINFYVTLVLADDPSFEGRAAVEEHFQCRFSQVLLRGFMALYISSFDFSAASLCKLELYDVA